MVGIKGATFGSVRFSLFCEDNILALSKLADNSVDSIVTDPPYGLSFMGKKWDYDVPSVETWKECLRVLEPGGYLLSFAGTRTQHRMAVNIEDAGFEIRDMIAWIYGSGFPKSLNVGKAVDKLQGNMREFVSENPANRPYNLTTGETSTGWKSPPRPDKTKGTSPYEGWGTALKPALEPITLARKPLSEKTVAENVLKYGTGGINIDDCRVGVEERPVMVRTETVVSASSMSGESTGATSSGEVTTQGRWPANLILDDSEEVVSLFPTAGKGNGGLPYSYSGKEYDNKDTSMFNGDKPQAPSNFNDRGSAARFFKECKGNEVDLCQDQNQSLSSASIVEKSLYQQNQVEDFVQRLVAIRDNPEDRLLKNILQPFMNEMQSLLKQSEKLSTKPILSIGKKCLQELKLTITEELNQSHVRFAEIQKLTNTMMIIQNLLNIDGFAEVVISNSMLNNMVLGEKVFRFKYCAKASKKDRNDGCEDFEDKQYSHDGRDKEIENAFQRNKSVAKNNHPTVKPHALMVYLTRLVTPKNGVVLDPFMGSGSTGKACMVEGFNFIGMELDKEYFEIAKARILHEVQQVKQPDLFKEVKIVRKARIRGDS